MRVAMSTASADLRQDKLASSLRNKSSIFDDEPTGGETESHRRQRAGPRPEDRSSANIFGSAPEERGPVKNYLASTVFAEPEESKRSVKNYQKSTIFDAPEEKQRVVRDHQRSSVFAGEKPAAGVASGVTNGSRRSAGEYRPRAFNPITGQCYGGAQPASNTPPAAAATTPTDNLPGGTSTEEVAAAEVDRVEQRSTTSEEVVVVEEAPPSPPPTPESAGRTGVANNNNSAVANSGRTSMFSPSNECSPRTQHHRVTQPPGGISHGLW